MNIKPIEQIWTTDGVHHVQIKIYDPHKVRKLEANFEQAIEALKDNTIFFEEINGKVKDNLMDQHLTNLIFINIGIIEKAYNMKWKELIK